jgi:hypothetical protein
MNRFALRIMEHASETAADPANGSINTSVLGGIQDTIVLANLLLLP